MRYIYCNGRRGERYKEAKTMANDRFVAYYRVSTVKQGVSGLGLDSARGRSVVPERRALEEGGGVHGDRKR